MNYIRPSYMALAILAGTAGPANACPPCGPMMAPISAAPDVSGAVNAASGANSSATGSFVKGTRDGVQAANEFSDVKAKIRAKNPKAGDKEVNAAAIQIIKNRRQKEQAEWKRRDNEETNRLRKAQQDRENYNPNAEQYRPSGVTEQEHNELNQRSLPGKPDGTE